MSLYDFMRQNILEDAKLTKDNRDNYIVVEEDDTASISVYDALDGEVNDSRYTIRNPLFINRGHLNFMLRISDSAKQLDCSVDKDQLLNYLDKKIDKNMLCKLQRILIVTGDEEDTDSLYKDGYIAGAQFEAGHDLPYENQVGLYWKEYDVALVNLKTIVNTAKEEALVYGDSRERCLKEIGIQVAATLVHEFRHSAHSNPYLPKEILNPVIKKDNSMDSDEWEDKECEEYARKWVDLHPPGRLIVDNTIDKTKLESIKNKWVYDIEVFAHDWMLVAYQPESKRFVQFHNDNRGVHDWIDNEKPFLIGFNNKHYDDYIILGILKGNSPETIKDHNDYIIEGRSYLPDGSEYVHQPWLHHSIQGEYRKNYFSSMDVSNDLPRGMSLKRIQGNCGDKIVESPIPFDIPRKLKDKEVELILKYCKNDVEATNRLLDMRKQYFETKLEIAEMGGIDPKEALGYTNARLVAKFLGAKKLEGTARIDEFEYEVPSCVQLGEHGKQVLDFYHQFTVGTESDHKSYGKSTTININGVNCKVGWGGLHGAKENYAGESTPERKIVDIDVSSYYPSMMLQFGYFSKALNQNGRARYKEVYNNRMKNKREGKSDKAGAQKLVLNTAFGCCKSFFNDMYHPKTSNNICITGQLMLIDLMEKLDKHLSFELVQANTDGIIFSYDVKEEKNIQKTISEWEKRTGMNMEYVDIHKIVQKDVNNYVLISGETYAVKKGKKVLLKEDKHKEVHKGGWTNQKDVDEAVVVFPILKEAICKKLLYDIPVEKTINECNDIFQFQMVAKPVKGTIGAVAYKDGVATEVQRVNRIYASADHTNEKVYWTTELGNGRVVTECPEHAVVDNNNQLTMKDIDKQWYIEVANERVQNFLAERSKRKKKTVKMADLFADLSIQDEKGPNTLK